MENIGTQGWSSTVAKIRRYYGDGDGGGADEIDMNQIMDDWDCKKGQIDIIDCLCDCFYDTQPPILDLEIVYKKIRDNTLFKERMNIYGDLYIYITKYSLIKHFIDNFVITEYQCMYLRMNIRKQLLNAFIDYLKQNKIIDNSQNFSEQEKKDAKISFHDSFYFSNIEAPMIWIQALSIQIGQLLCADFEDDILRAENPQNALNTQFFENWCELTNRRLDVVQKRFNKISKRVQQNDNKMVKEDWRNVCNKFHSCANKVALLVLLPKYEWVRKHKQQLYEDCVNNVALASQRSNRT